MKYTVIIEKGPTSYGAYIPDLPGCVAVAETREEVVSLIREAIIFHMEGMAEDGETIPGPTSTAIEVDVRLPASPEEIAVETGS
jgi:predicted RNase H-like HicB family nuclease